VTIMAKHVLQPVLHFEEDLPESILELPRETDWVVEHVTDKKRILDQAAFELNIITHLFQRFPEQEVVSRPEQLEKELKQLRKELTQIKGQFKQTSKKIEPKMTRGESIYEELLSSLSEYDGKIVAIEEEHKEVAGVGDTIEEAYANAKKRFPDVNKFYFRRVGEDYLIRI